MSSHVDSDEPPPLPAAKRQRCTKKKTHAWNVEHVHELTRKHCHCNGGRGQCLMKFSGLESKVADLRMQLKALPEGEADLTVVNMMYGVSEIDLAVAEEHDRISDSSQECSRASSNPDDGTDRIESEGDDRVDSSRDEHRTSGSDKPPRAGKAHGPRRKAKKSRYAQKVLGVTTCSRAMMKLLGCRHPDGAGKKRGGGRRL